MGAYWLLELSVNELAQLAYKYGTDKQGGHSYTQHYHRHFEPFRNRAMNVLEIGIGGYDDPKAGGQSLRMWKEYFPQANIVGLDICDKSSHEEDRIHTFVGSQTDPATFKQLYDKFGVFDLIIDDGSHVNAHVLTSFGLLFPRLPRGGIYVVEDMQTAYWPAYGGSSDLKKENTSVNFFKTLIDNLNYNEIIRPGYIPTHLDENVFGLHFYHNMLFIDKLDNTEPSNILVQNIVPDGFKQSLGV